MTSGSGSGVQIISSYSLGGSRIDIINKVVKRGDYKKDLDEVQWNYVTLAITKLTGTNLSYAAISKSLNKQADVECVRP